MRISNGNNYHFTAVNKNNNDKVEVGSWSTASGSREYLINRQGGNVGIGLDDPNYTLDVDGNIAAQQSFRAIDGGKGGGTPLVYIGDDAFLTDLDRANTLGIRGLQNSNIGIVELGKGNGKIVGYGNGDMCMGSTC